jgi:hypothetical protein
MSRIAILGASALGQQLAVALSVSHHVRLIDSVLPKELTGVELLLADLTSIPEVEVALAGTETVIFLARASETTAEFSRASTASLDLLLATTAARAAQLVAPVQRFAVQADPTSAEIFEEPHWHHWPQDEAKILQAALIQFGVSTPAQSESSPALLRRFQTLSVQSFSLASPLDAYPLALRYFEWISKTQPGVSVSQCDDVFRIRLARIEMLQLRFVAGRSDARSAYFNVIGGMLAARKANGRFEFRIQAKAHQTEAMCVLTNFKPMLPFFIYRFTQAIAHEFVMKRFSQAAGQQQ